MQSGQVNLGHGVFTVIAVPPGSAHHIALAVDNHAQNVPVARLRVAFFDTAWRVHPDVIIDGNNGAGIMAFPDAAKTSVVSIPPATTRATPRMRLRQSTRARRVR